MSSIEPVMTPLQILLLPSASRSISRSGPMRSKAKSRLDFFETVDVSAALPMKSSGRSSRSESESRDKNLPALRQSIEIYTSLAWNTSLFLQLLPRLAEVLSSTLTSACDKALVIRDNSSSIASPMPNHRLPL